eukprot:scaffold170_cov281-Pinguiococcus_pyrenoidosus.AAC.5
MRPSAVPCREVRAGSGTGTRRPGVAPCTSAPSGGTPAELEGPWGLWLSPSSSCPSSSPSCWPARRLPRPPSELGSPAAASARPSRSPASHLKSGLEVLNLTSQGFGARPVEEESLLLLDVHALQDDSVCSGRESLNRRPLLVDALQACAHHSSTVQRGRNRIDDQAQALLQQLDACLTGEEAAWHPERSHVLPDNQGERQATKDEALVALD